MRALVFRNVRVINAFALLIILIGIVMAARSTIVYSLQPYAYEYTMMHHHKDVVYVLPTPTLDTKRRKCIIRLYYD